jgi:CheY-like chemotaxis protein
MSIQNMSQQYVVPSVCQIRHQGWPNTRVKSARVHGRGGEKRNIPSSLPLAGTTGEPTRILIVDHVDSTVPLECLLHNLGYWTTRVAFCGDTALTLAGDFFPSVVFLALDLPDMSAYRVAQSLRERTKVRKLRLIALTGDYEHAGRDQAREAGFERYLAKPVSVSALQQLLRGSLP